MADNEYIGIGQDLFSSGSEPVKQPGAKFGVYAADAEPVRGESVELARELNLPVGTVERNFDELSRLAKRKRIDYDKIAADSPLTNDWLSDPVNASVAQDDIENLSGIEQAWGYLKKGGSALASGLPKFNEGIYGAAQFGVDTARTYATGPLSTPFDVGPFQFQALPSDPLEPVSDFFGELRQGQSGLAGRMMPKAEGITEQGVYSGLQSLGQNMLTLPAAILSGNPAVALGPMVGGVAGSEYGRARDKGVPYSQAAVYATSQGIVEYYFERNPVTMLLSDIERNTGFMKTLAKQMWAEGWSEQFTTLIQDLNEWAVLNPEKSFQQYLDERPNAAYQTLIATAVGTGGMVATGTAINKAANAFDARANKAAKAADTRKALENLSKLAANTKVKNVSPSTMQAFADHVTQGGSVYIDAQDLTNALQQSGIDLAQALADIPSLGQVPTIGNSIKIPASDIMTKIAGTQYEQAMLDHLKLDPNDLSQAEADEIIKGNNETAKAEVARIIKSKRDIDAHEASAEVVRKQIEEQLNTANRFSKDVNRTNAQLISSFYSAYAAKVGVTPEELAKQYPLRVTAEAVGGQRVLNQFAGESALTADLGALETAKQQVEQGIDAEQVRKDTGWHKGVDGKWRFEIDDSNAEIVRRQGDVLSGADLFAEAAKNDRGVLLGRVLKHDALYAAYPKLKAVRFVVSDEYNGRGAYSALDNTVIIGEPYSFKSDDDIKNLVLHEIQHAIQTREGFAAGGSVAGMRGYALEESKKIIEKEYRNLPSYKKAKDENKLDQWVENMVSATGKGVSPVDAYRRLAGEIEARNTEARSGMTAEQRRASPPEGTADTPASDAIIVWNGKEMAANTLNQDYPLAPQGEWWGDADYETRGGKIVNISPDEYLSQVKPIDQNSELTQENVQDLIDHIQSGRKLDPLVIYADGKEDGRHRALAAKRLGFKTVPVIDYRANTLNQSAQPLPDTIDIDGKQRPTLDSAGRPIHHTAKGVKNFWGWFDGSVQRGRVAEETGASQDERGATRDGAGAAAPPGNRWTTDGAGRPRVFYHGTADSFDTFDVDHKNKKDLGWLGKGVYVTSDSRLADSYANLKGGTGQNTMPLYAAVRNPLVATAQDKQRLRFASKEVIAAWTEKVKEAGYDGVALEFSDGTIELVAFDPAAVKSSSGNNGAFDPNDPNILNQDDAAPNAQISFADDITSTPTVITLLKGANLSSFIHESGHFFLEVLNDISSRPNAPKQMVDDFDAVMNEFGVTREQWKAMSLEEKRPYHEKLARLFETYAWEGKSPSMALNKVFQRFRAWMLDAYKKLLDAFNTKDLGQALDVKLSDEVRAVFDRMLATQEQIDEANAVRGSLPMFETKEQAEKAGVDWDQYRSDIEQARQDAITTLEARSLRDMQWFRNAHSREVRRLRRESASLRREARIDARAEVMSSPIYQAVQFLTAPVDVLKAKKAKGDPNVVDPVNDTLLVAVAKLGGLQRDMAVDQFGLDPADFKAQPVFSKPVLRKTGGLTPDGMAEALAQLGYLPSKNGTWDLNDLGDFLHDEGKGIPHYSATFDYRNLEEQQAGLPDLDANPFVGGRLDRDSMVREYGGSVESFPWENLGKMVSNEGIHPDVIADRFGFSSGDEMVRALLEAKDITTAIEDTTDRIMFERHGDLTSKEALNKAADEAIHNQMRAKVLATEANALAKTMGAKGITAKAAKLFAERILAGMRILDIKPNHFAAEESKAAARFEKARAKGNTKDAAMEKRNQLVNNIAARLAYEAETEVSKKVKHFKQLQKPGSQKAMRGEYLEQLNALLERFDLRTASQTRKAAKRATELPVFADWLKAKAEELGQPTPEMVPFVLDGGVSKPYTDLTLEEFRGLVDAVAQLEHMARREQHQYQAIRNQTFAEELAANLASLQKHHPEAFNEDGSPKDIATEFVPSFGAGAADLGDKFLGEFLSFETNIEILEGGELGPLHESLFKRISDRTNWRSTRLQGIFAKMQPLFDQYSLVEKQRFSTQDIGGNIGQSITREKAISVALHNGNENGRKRLGNFGWTPEKITSVIDLLDERDMKLVTGIWELFDQDLWPDLKGLNERTRGLSPPKVVAMPYTTRLGTFGGGYYHLAYDKKTSNKAVAHDAQSAIADLRNGLGYNPSTRQGTSKEQKKEVKERLRLDLGVFTETVFETVHDIAYREAVADTMRMLNNETLMQAIKVAGGHAVYASLIKRVGEIATPPKNPVGWIEKISTIARRNTVVTLMSGVGTAFQNLTGFIPALVRVNPWLLSREIAKFYTGLESYRFCIANSKYMEHRFTSYEHDLINMAKKLTVKGSFMPEAGTFLALMGWIDRGVAVPVWNASFAEGMDKFSNDKDKAVEYADHVVRQTQGSARPIDRPDILSGGPLKMLFVMFNSYFNGQLQQLVRAGLIGKQEAKANPRKAVARVTAGLILIWILPALVTEAFRRTPDDEDDEEKAWRYAKGVALYPAAMFPFVRDFAPFLWDKLVHPPGYQRPVSVTPITAAFEGVGKGAESLQDAASGEADVRDVQNMLMATGFAFGLPGILMSKVVTGTEAFLAGEAGPEAMLLGPEPKK